MKTVIVSGALANKAGHGGESWVRLNWLLGFRELGWEVHFIEEIARESCVSEAGKPATFAASANRAYFERVTQEFGFGDSATLICNNGAEFFGADAAQLATLAARTDLLVNIGGHLRYEPVFARVKRRAYVDIDPGFTQFWTAQGNPGARLDGHDAFFTIGENIGSDDCLIPTCDRHWVATRPPVALKAWPVARSPQFEGFTTVASWRGPFGPVEFGGVTYGLKVHEFRKVLAVPQRSGQRFTIALNIHPGDEKDRRALDENSWEILDPSATTADPQAFREFVQDSGAEFSVAQGIYVQTNSGWFSDRSAAYLASGRPALVQETGFNRYLPVGEGLLSFHNLDEAATGARRIAADYTRHCRNARMIAEEYFDAARVLPRFLEHLPS